MLVLFVLFVWSTAYYGRQSVIRWQRAGCERGKLDRAANADGWRSAEAARRADGDLDVARRYARIAAGLEARSRIDCQKAYPDPGLFGY